MKLYVKFMVSVQCKKIVQEKLDKMGLNYKGIDLCEVEVKDNITVLQRQNLKAELMVSGYELLDDITSSLIEKIKEAIIDIVHYSEELPRKKTRITWLIHSSMIILTWQMCLVNLLESPLNNTSFPKK